jgi:hypothetical protein
LLFESFKWDKKKDINDYTGSLLTTGMRW